MEEVETSSDDEAEEGGDEAEVIQAEASPLGKEEERIDLPSRAGSVGSLTGTLSREDARPPGAERAKTAVRERRPDMQIEAMPGGRGARAEWAQEMAGLSARIERLESWIKSNRLT